MPSRRKLIEQVVGKYCFNGEALSAAGTTAHASAEIDRQGYLSAHFNLQQKGATGVLTSQYTTIHIYETDVSTGAYTIKNSATDTISSTFTTSSAQSVGLDVDLAGYERYIKVYITPSGALSNTTTVSVAAILGDAINEPAT